MNHITKEKLIETERKIADLWENGDLPYLVHLSGGNEDQLLSIFNNVRDGDYVFGSHRAHYHYLLAGGSPETLIERVKEGNSMFLFDRKLNFYTSSIVAGTAGIAAGVALALKHSGKPGWVWCFLGDGAADEGHLHEASRLVDGRDLPCTFIIEDNDTSVETPSALRYGKHSGAWPRCVHTYQYKTVYPHAGSGCKHHIQFKTTVKK